MNSLAIDTSTSQCVLGVSKGQLRYTRVIDSGRSHSRDILPNIESLMAEAQLALQELDVIIFGQGPGSFTGLRIAVGVVQGLGYGLGIPVVPLSTLACLAYGEFVRSGAENVLVALTARQEEVFYGAYSMIDDEYPTFVISESVCDVRALPSLTGDWSLIGSGSNLQTKIERATGIGFIDVQPDCQVSPDALLSLGEFRWRDGSSVSAMDARPEYLRQTVAVKPSR